MFNSTQDRRAKIVELLRGEQFLSIGKLTDHFQISVATARRDLSELHEAGLCAGPMAELSASLRLLRISRTLLEPFRTVRRKR